MFNCCGTSKEAYPFPREEMKVHAAQPAPMAVDMPVDETAAPRRRSSSSDASSHGEAATNLHHKEVEHAAASSSPPDLTRQALGGRKGKTEADLPVTRRQASPVDLKKSQSNPTGGAERDNQDNKTSTKFGRRPSAGLLDQIEEWVSGHEKPPRENPYAISPEQRMMHNALMKGSQYGPLESSSSDASQPKQTGGIVLSFGSPNSGHKRTKKKKSLNTDPKSGEEGKTTKKKQSKSKSRKPESPSGIPPEDK